MLNLPKLLFYLLKFAMENVWPLTRLFSNNIDSFVIKFQSFLFG